MHLSLLFNVLLTHGVVRGVVIPLIKNEANPLVSDNYRGISPVISKLFEMVLLSLFDQHLLSSPLQFGFKSLYVH